MGDVVVRVFNDFDDFLYACEKYKPLYLAPPEVELFKSGDNFLPLVVISVPVKLDGVKEIWKTEEHFYDVYMNTFFLNKLKRYITREEAQRVKEDLIKFQKLYNEKFVPLNEKKQKLRDEYLSIPYYDERIHEAKERLREAEKEVDKVLLELFDIAKPYIEKVLRERGIYYGTSRDIPGSVVYY